MENITALKEDPQHLFAGLRSLLLGFNYPFILEKFRTPFEDWQTKSGKADSDLTSDDLYKYNSELDVRIIYQDDGGGEFYRVNQSFDDFFIQYIDREKYKILAGLKKIVYNSVSYDSLKIRMQLFLKEVSNLPDPSVNKTWAPLTDKAYDYITETVKEIKDYICAQLNLEEDNKLHYLP